MTAATHRKELAKLLRAASHRHALWDVFRDFLELAALSVANAVSMDQAREQRYMAAIARYTPDEAALFPKMLGELVMGLDAEPHDLLGTLFGELDLGNAAMGQFFTPYHVCRLMADLTVDDAMVERIQRRGFVTVQEPAVGAGAMVIAIAQALQGRGYSFQKHMHVTAVDVDLRAVHMAYLQFSLLGIPAVVVHGNTLTLEQHSVWFTPMHVMGAWPARLSSTRGDVVPLPPEAAVPAAPEPSVAPMGQLDLFFAAHGVSHG